MIDDAMPTASSRAAVLDDLRVLATDFGRLFATDCECHLLTDREYWPSRSPEPPDPPAMRSSGRCDRYMSGKGVEVEPRWVRSIEDAKRAEMFYDRAGRPVANSVGEPLIVAPGWANDHCVELRGPGAVRAVETIERANRWVVDSSGVLAPILWPGRSLRVWPFCWPDVVAAVADLAGRSSLKSNSWFVTAAGQSYSLTVWRRRADFELPGPMVPPEVVQRIGDEPENIWAERPAFLRDSETASQWLIDRLAEPVSDEIEGGDSCDRDGLSADGRNLHWGGGVYPIGPGCVGVVRLLVESFHSGKPYLSQAYLMTEGECDTELRTLVKNNKLEGVLVRQKNPDGTIPKGMWGLADPVTIKKKTTTR